MPVLYRNYAYKNALKHFSLKPHNYNIILTYVSSAIYQIIFGKAIQNTVIHMY